MKKVYVVVSGIGEVLAVYDSEDTAKRVVKVWNERCSVSGLALAHYQETNHIWVK
jgi:predicted restriction endonuclease